MRGKIRKKLLLLKTWVLKYVLKRKPKKNILALCAKNVSLKFEV